MEELTGKKVGIIGYGNTGSATAEKLNAFGSKVFAYDKFVKGFGNERVKECSVEEIFAHAEIVSMHIPFNHQTHYFCDRPFFKSFSNEIIFINTYLINFSYINYSIWV